MTDSAKPMTAAWIDRALRIEQYAYGALLLAIVLSMASFVALLVGCILENFTVGIAGGFCGLVASSIAAILKRGLYGHF